jgi:SAM-dependent methyltransferase
MQVARQYWLAERYAETAHFVPALGAPVLLAPVPGERILDLGCGDGILTKKIRAVGAAVVAVDAGPEPGGRFVAEMGGHNNTAAIIVALSAVLARRGLDAHQLNPWYFPSAEACHKKLEDRFAEDFLGPLSEPDRLPARGEVADLLRPVLMDETGTWIADYVRLRFRATRAQ